MKQTIWQLGRQSLRVVQAMRLSAPANITFDTVQLINLLMFIQCIIQYPTWQWANVVIIQIYSQSMYEGHSQNNSLLPKQQYNIDQSFVMAPISQNRQKMNQYNLKNNKKSSFSKPTLGDYQQFKLTQYLNSPPHSQQNQLVVKYSNMAGDNNHTGYSIDVVTIDQDSQVMQIGNKFTQLMIKYANTDVCFATVCGQKQVGKSFFCDKILNLAEIKGNNFSQKNLPGIYTYPNPFTKDGLCVFLLEIAGCDLNSNLFRMLNTLAMILSSTYIFLADNNQRDSQTYLNQFSKSLHESFKKFQFQSSEEGQKIEQFIFPHQLYYISRSKDNQTVSQQLNKSLFFKQFHSLYLPDAMTASYKGSKSDLSSFSFLAKECINPEYIKRASQIFKMVYRTIGQKRYKQLIINGNIVTKLVSIMSMLINGNRKIKIQQIYEDIIQQLYKSAFNYCVLNYHQELEEYFDDEQPKNADQMYQAFEKASQNAFNRFNQFNLNKQLHDSYYNKLTQHIDEKQLQICMINKQKTQEHLLQEFGKHRNNYKGDAKELIKKLKTTKTELNDGRAEALQDCILEIFSSMGSGAGLRRYEQLCNQKDNLEQQWKKQSSKIQGKRKQEELKKNKYIQLEKQQAQVDKQIKKLKEEKQHLLNKQNDKQALNKIKVQYEKLLAKSSSVEEELKLFRNQKNDEILAKLKQSNEEKISRIIKRQKEIQSEIAILERQDAESMAKGDKKRPSNKLKQNQGKPNTKKSVAKEQATQSELKPKAKKTQASNTKQKS